MYELDRYYVEYLAKDFSEIKTDILVPKDPDLYATTTILMLQWILASSFFPIYETAIHFN